MPNNLAPSDTSGDIKSLKSRLTKLENLPQLGNSSILNGSVEILNATGQIVMVMGIQPGDGVVGIGLYDPATGTRLALFGQINLSPVQYGLVVANSAGTLQQVGGVESAVITSIVTTSSTTFTDLGGPSVTAEVGPSGSVLVTITATVNLDGGYGGNIAISVDGTAPSTTILCGVSDFAASTAVATASYSQEVTGLTAGSHTFAIWYGAVNASGPPLFLARSIVVTAL